MGFLTILSGAAVKQRPVNVVGPIVAAGPGHTDDREDLLSMSGADSMEEDADHVRLQEDLLAQRKLITKLQEDLSSQLKVCG